MVRYCELQTCDNPLPPDSGENTHFCSTACRKKQSAINRHHDISEVIIAEELDLSALSQELKRGEHVVKQNIMRGYKRERPFYETNGQTLGVVVSNLRNHFNYYRMKKGGKTDPRFTKAKPQPAPGNSLSDDQIQNEYPVLTPSEAVRIYDKVHDLLKTNQPLNESDKKAFEQYEGRGGRIDTGVIDESVVHQFYTPYIICKKMIELAQHFGFAGGTIVEPACGTGRFFKFAPSGSELIGFDIDITNIEVAKRLYPQATLYHQAFETAFLQPPNFNKKAKKSWLPEADLIIGNPPYGDYAGYYKTYMPSLYSRFEFLFIRLGLELLKPGGLLVFIISQNLMNNGAAYSSMKKDILELGEFVDAYRLPNGIFTSTAVGTDIVIFKRK